MKFASSFAGLGAVAASLLGSVSAASYDTIPAIEVYGQHFFYTNNGSQFFMKGVAYQQDYSANETTDSNVTYIDPLADADGCKRDIPYMKQIFTNVIRVYAIDPTKDHDDCMSQFAAADIYVIADMSSPSVSIESDDPEWTTTIYDRYTSVVDALQKYQNVIGFFAGNENVSSNNQTAAAAYVKAAVRDIKGYIGDQNYRSSLGVGYATADVPSRDQLAHYFACEPGNGGNSTQIDFWGYNVYSWCGDSNYVASSYDTRVEFFSDYPVPVFFAEYGCNSGLPGGPTSRPFTEVAVLYGNMTSVFSGGIVYEWFMGANDYGLVKLTDNDASVSPYPDFTSLSSQLAKVSPSSTMRSAYTPSNSAPACPTVDATWLATASPLPPSPNSELCDCMAASLQCNVESTNEDDYSSVFNYVCGANEDFCTGIDRNATTGTYGGYSGCDSKNQLAWVANEYYLGNSKSSSACGFSGVATVQTATTASTCTSLLNDVGTAGTGTAASPTAKATGDSTDGSGASGSSSGSKGAAAGFSGPKAVEHGGLIMGIWSAVAAGSFLGMLAL